jgi:hypothetical protein
MESIFAGSTLSAPSAAPVPTMPLAVPALQSSPSERHGVAQFARVL